MERSRWSTRGAKLCALASAVALLALPVGARATTAGVVGWCYDNFGQADPPPGNDYVAVSAGCYHSLALRSDGTIAAWGYITSAQHDALVTAIDAKLASLGG